MAWSAAKACGTHLPLASQMLAENAATLHGLAYPHCPGPTSVWPCRDHWHWGHASKVDGDACKDHPQHRATVRELRRLGLIR